MGEPKKIDLFNFTLPALSIADQTSIAFDSTKPLIARKAAMEELIKAKETGPLMALVSDKTHGIRNLAIEGLKGLGETKYLENVKKALESAIPRFEKQIAEARADGLAASATDIATTLSRIPYNVDDSTRRHIVDSMITDTPFQDPAQRLVKVLKHSKEIKDDIDHSLGH
jgi:hypothetical protein